ncbi:MAG: polymer-forming cytoskeletal protein [Acidobacteriaceae bacterium]|nr:polymer-forming cytoskeletal protein [Acidobacteriaceae bacterium]MBV9763315.1 polymer-forming cytoskeletal protein [Acidobacteriaceae bacterium]
MNYELFMWSDRKQENHSFTRSPGSNDLAESAVEGLGAVTSLAVIGRGMIIRGHIKSREGLYVDGEVDGTLELPDCRLTVGPHGKVAADSTAREVEVLGSIHGDLQASKRITIRKGGRLVGDLRTPAIVIEEGAYFKGKIEIVNNGDEVSTAISHTNGKTAARA